MESSPSEDMQSPSIRRSVRKKVQTTHYGHTPELSSSSMSRKAETPESEETSEDKKGDVESSDSDSIDTEEVATPVKGRKRAGKTLKKQPVAKKAKSAKRKSSSSFIGGDAHGSMFDIIYGGKAALQVVVDDWIKGYNIDSTSAMVDLIQFVIQCCGCKGEVTPDMLEEEKNVNAIRKLTEEFDEESDVYPLSGPDGKKFNTNFSEFIECLIQRCQHSIVYDDFMLEKLIAWLISLSDSQVRAFRHTSTLAGMKLVAALIHIALNVNVELDNTQRQLDSEKQKAAAKRGVQKMEKLQERKTQLRDNLRELEEFMSYIFQGIFIHRYRDIRPEIRSLCISEIGCWMKDYSSLFLSHKYLKYVVWTIHDKVGDVRLSALQSLLRLYEIEEFLPQLEPLTSRFKGRIVGMTLDKESTVTVEAIRLVTLLYQYGELDEEDCQQVEQLVFCSHPQIAHEAGKFLHKRLLTEAESSSSSKKRGKKSQFQQDCEYMKRLIEFFVTSQIHNHGSYIVDGIWQACEILKDWKLMTTMLLEGVSNKDFSDDEETALIEIMTCCCRHAATGHGPPGRVSKKSLSVKEKKTIINDKQEMSAHFMEKLPALLEKYGTDSPKAENLVAIAQYFDLEEYSQRRLGKHLEELLDQIDELVEKSAETSLLNECAKTYLTLTNNELTIRSKAEVAFKKLIDSIVQSFQEACTNLKAEEGGNEDDSYTLKVNLKRITEFYKSHDLKAWDLYENLLWLGQSENVSEEIITLALTSMQMLVLWGLISLDSDNPNKRDMKLLKQRFKTYVDTCSDIINFAQTMETRKHAFLSLCDSMIVFAKQLTNKYPLFASVVYHPDQDLQTRCESFVNEFVFANTDETEANEDEDNTEAEVEELSGKRKVLAGLCKLVIFGIFDMKFAHCVFSKMVSGFGDYGDIIKHTMAKCKEINKTAFTKHIFLTLKGEFIGIRDGDGGIIKASESFIALRELAKRLSCCFGIDTSKPYVRASMVTLQSDGISFALEKIGEDSEPDENRTGFPNILFFDLLSECISKLIPQDRKLVLKLLQDQATAAKIDLNKLEKELMPLSSYLKTLKEGSQGTSGKATKTRQPARKTKRELSFEGKESEQKKRATKKSEGQRKDEEDEKEESDEEVETQEEDRETEERKRVTKKAEPKEEEEEEDEEGAETHEGESSEASPKSSSPTSPKDTEKVRSAKRKRDTDEEDNADEKNDENSEDDFQQSGRSKSSQVSWISSQPKRSVGDTSVTYGKNSRRGRKSVGRTNKETIEEEKEDDEIESNGSSSPKPSLPQAKRKRKEFPENIFDESPAPETQSDSDLVSAF